MHLGSREGGREGGRKNTQGLGRGSLQTHGEAKCIGSSGIHAETDGGGGAGNGEKRQMVKGKEGGKGAGREGGRKTMEKRETI